MVPNFSRFEKKITMALWSSRGSLRVRRCRAILDHAESQPVEKINITQILDVQTICPAKFRVSVVLK